MTTRRVYAVITGGGTGGHVTPALAIADALVARGHARDEIAFVGARRGLEANAVPDAGYDIELLGLDGIQRSFAPRDLVRSLRAVLAFARALLHCYRTLRRAEPDVVVGVGGYASAPCVLGARLARIPTVVHEQNAVPGLVNRVAVRLGARAAVSFPGSRWPEATVTGNPLRAEMLATTHHPATPPRLAIVGGSLGAGRLNELGLALYDRWRDRTDVAVTHVAGPTHAAACRDRLDAIRRPTDRLDYDLVDFETDMAGLYARAALLVCRAGATTVAEVTAVGVPAVYVPWSGSAEGQQDANARMVVARGGGVLVADTECTPSRVVPLVEELLGDPSRLDSMANAARRLGRPDAAELVVDLVEEVARAAA